MKRDAYNPLYTVHIACRDLKIDVFAPIPETFMFDMSASYEAPFSSGITGKIANIGKFVGIKGVNQAMTVQLWQGSSDTELGLELEFQAEQDAYAEVMQPINELYKLVTPSTDTLGGFMKAPGPQIGDALYDTLKKATGYDDANEAQENDNTPADRMRDQNKETSNGRGSNKDTDPSGDKWGTVKWAKQHISNQIAIRVGQYAYFDSVVITNVQKTYTSQFDARGNPMHARVSVRFRPLFMVVQEDLNTIFRRQ